MNDNKYKLNQSQEERLATLATKFYKIQKEMDKDFEALCKIFHKEGYPEDELGQDLLFDYAFNTDAEEKPATFNKCYEHIFNR